MDPKERKPQDKLVLAVQVLALITAVVQLLRLLLG